MAADNELRLVNRAIIDRNIIPILERGIRDDWIVDDDLRRVWKFVREHYSNYQEVPSAATVQDNFPNFRFIKVEDSIEYLLDTMVDFQRRKLTRNGVEDIVQALTENDHERALVEMSKTVTVVNEQGIKGTTLMDVTKTGQAVLEEYHAVQHHEFLGIPTGFSRVDEASGGLQGGQLITLIAPPKTGKSQAALRIAANAHERGHTVMYQSFEMTNHEQRLRYVAMESHISLTRLRQGKLTSLEYERFEDTMNEMEQIPNSFHLVDAINGLTIDSLVATAQQLAPELLVVDGVYLMMDQVTGEANTPQALTNITRGLKRVAQAMNIPVIITTQTLLWKMKGGKVSADSIGYSSSFFQDSDVILGLDSAEDDDNIRTLRIVQSRNTGPTSNTVTWNFDTGCFHDATLFDEDNQPMGKVVCPWCSDLPAPTTLFY